MCVKARLERTRGARKRAAPLSMKGDDAYLYMPVGDDGEGGRVGRRAGVVGRLHFDLLEMDGGCAMNGGSPPQGKPTWESIRIVRYLLQQEGRAKRRICTSSLTSKITTLKGIVSLHFIFPGDNKRRTKKQ